MAHKKGQGSVKNGRDSTSKRLGVKKFEGAVIAGNISFASAARNFSRQKRWPRAGLYDLCSRDGSVKFDRNGRRVNVEPAASAS
jgi:large subunit ribosomal protein L27